MFKIHLPEASCNIDILLFLLDHQAPLPPQFEHCVLDGQLLNVGVLDVHPELEDGNVGARSPNPCTTVHQDWPLSICKLRFDHLVSNLVLWNVMLHSVKESSNISSEKTYDTWSLWPDLCTVDQIHQDPRKCIRCCPKTLRDTLAPWEQSDPAIPLFEAGRHVWGPRQEEIGQISCVCHSSKVNL